MSSSINSLNSASFTAIARPSTEGALHHSRKHRKHHGVDNDSSTTNATTETSGTRESEGSNSNQRNLTRAARDVAHTLRSVGRDTSRLLDQIGSNADLADKVKSLSSDFEKTLNDRYDAFVQGGGQNYMDFVEQTAAARRDFRAQLRDISHNLPTTDTNPTTDTTPPTDPNTSVDSTSANTTTVDTIEPGTGSNPGGSAPGIDRAQRDIEALVRGLDREGQQYASDPDATAKFNSMRDGFIDSIKKEFDSLAQGNTPSYIDFAERVASMRMAFTRDLRTTFGSTPPSNPANPTVDPSAVPQDAAVADLQPRNSTDTGTVTPPKAESGTTTVASIDVPATDPSDATPPPPTNRNIERARHDAEALLNGLNRDSTRLLNAMGDTPEARQVSERADAFRSMLEDRLKEFVKSGGSNYMDFVGQMASARQSLTNFFHEMAGPKLDHLG